MRTILNLYRKDTMNVGDLKSSPFDHFELPGWNVIRRDILDSIDEAKRADWEASFDAADCVVVGGGGLLDIDYFEPSLREMYLRRRSAQHFVVWGAGHNHYWVGGWPHLRRHVDLIPYNYSLIGLRDVSDTYHWAPCTSCMDQAFDRQYDIANSAVLYKHVEMHLGDYEMGLLPDGIKIIDNYTPFEEVIETLGSSELVLTSSFHGAYWGTLLRRKVVAFPFSSKFYGLKHAVPLCDVRDWKRYSELSKTYPHALDDCRQASFAFFQSFSELLEGKR